jgi:hypothetical protein
MAISNCREVAHLEAFLGWNWLNLKRIPQYGTAHSNINKSLKIVTEFQ